MLFWDNLRRRHPIGDEELNAYIDGELDAAARSRVEAHIESCAACRESVAELRTVSQALQSLAGAQTPRSFALREADVEPFPGRARQAGWLAGATPLLGGVAAVAFLAFFVLVGVDVTDRSADSDAGDSQASTYAAITEQGTALDAEMLEGLPEADDETRAAESSLPPAEDGAAPPEAPLAATGNAAPNNDLSNNGAVAGDEDTADDSVPGLLNLEPGGDDSSRLRIAEAATAAVAIVAGGSLALVWWRRRV
ncbi:MAG: zf-HC2 domain-containing protein [Chloroflexi bacterium]|nr:zf-HC2 domain-containing protein [Chloroflexota bacterium]